MEKFRVMVISISTFNYDEELFKDASDLRYKIFVEEFKNNKFNEFDSLDLEAIHYLLYNNNLPIGVARCIKSENRYFIDKFGVLNNLRSNGFGTLLIRFICNDLKHAKADIFIKTFVTSQKFFENNNFLKTETTENNKVYLKYSKL